MLENTTKVLPFRLWRCALSTSGSTKIIVWLIAPLLGKSMQVAKKSLIFAQPVDESSILERRCHESPPTAYNSLWTARVFSRSSSNLYWLASCAEELLCLLRHCNFCVTRTSSLLILDISPSFCRNSSVVSWMFVFVVWFIVMLPPVKRFAFMKLLADI